MARVVMIGATGLVGRSLAPMLLADGHELLVLGRRSSGIAGAAEKLGPMEEWSALLKGEKVDVAISTLGTTWRKAGSWDAFEKVDRTAVDEFAMAAKAAGARQMILVSSVGADATASNRYLALKGAVEADLGAIGFERLDIVRPGLLVGERGSERRTGERFGIFVSPLVNPFLRGRLHCFRAVPAITVAKAIAALTGNGGRGTSVHFNKDLEALASA